MHKKVAVKAGIFAPHLVEFDNYLCARCGYMEQYVRNSADRQRLVENWTRAGQEFRMR
ncbi:MAG TPA: hypothetical protein VJ183_19280 [Chloroflexia bacterium]|nr:hypothetical protein [Chloroflexia bacterium]